MARPARTPRVPRRDPSASSIRTRSTACSASTSATTTAARRTGIRAIINSALVSYERLPMLEIVFDRLVRLMTTSLRNFTSDNVEVSLDNITSIRFGDYLNSIPLPAILAVFRAEELRQLRPAHRRLQPDLFDRRRAARRPARHRGDAHRGPALHHDRAHAGAAHDRGRARRHDGRPSSRWPSRLHARPAGDQSALRRHRAARQRRHPGQAAHRHGRPRRAHRAAAALRHARADPQAAAAAVHGREVRPRHDLGRPSGDRAVDHRGRDRRRARRAGHDACARSWTSRSGRPCS